MRRPQQEPLHYHNHQHHRSSRSPPRSRQSHNKEESRLARVKRVLTGTLLGRSGGSSRVFGAPLDEVEQYQDTGVPYVVHRLSCYIEEHAFDNITIFRLSGGNPRLAERLRASFERRGDADLEGASCPATAATLLRQYLKELPQPLVPPTLVTKLLQVYSSDHLNNYEFWIATTKELLSTLPSSHYHLLGYLSIYFSKYESQHQRNAGVASVFAPVIFPYVPPATTLFTDILIAANVLFSDRCNDSANGKISSADHIVSKDTTDNADHTENSTLFCAPKRKDHLESCQERKLIRSNSEEKILENSTNSADNIRRVSSHEDFNSDKHLHILAQLQQDMGHGVRCSGIPLHERTNVSPVSAKFSPVPSTCDITLASDRLECDVERLRSSERFSRSITPRGRRQGRRRKVHRGTEFDSSASKENDAEPVDIYAVSNNTTVNGPPVQSFLEMLSSGPSRSPSPARPPDDHDNPTPTNWGFQHRQVNESEANASEAVLSPRNSLLIPRRFYLETDEIQSDVPDVNEIGLKSLAKQINGLKRKIKRYELEFEENYGYRPSHSDKMSNRDVKRLVYELSKLRKEHKMLKEGLHAFLTSSSLQLGLANNNNQAQEKSRTSSMEEMVREAERKLSEKRKKNSRSEKMEELNYEQLLDEKTAVQKALLHIENAFGRPVSKEDRAVVRPLYDKYRTLKRLLIRAGAKNQDSLSELATILEHETMDFTSSTLPGNSCESERRASEPDMSHRGILDCIEPSDQQPTDSDSQHSSSEGSRCIRESLHSLPLEELIAQQRVTAEEKKRLRRALKELEMQFEARAGRRMQREDRGPQISLIYESYKQTKAKLRLIEALLAKNS